MVSTRVKSQPKSSPRASSVASTPKAGRRLTPASVTPKKRAAPSAGRSGQNGKGKTKAEPKKPVKAQSDDEDDVTPSENSSSDDNDSEDAFNPDSSASEEEVVEESAESDIDSDFLDEDEEESASRKKRKTASKTANSSAKKSRGSIGRGKQSAKNDEDEDDEDPVLSEVDLEDGQTIAGRIYPAPTTGQVPAGRISMNTLKFLRNLQIPERNDREWFRSHEPAFRQAEKEWKAFVEKIQLKFFEADNEIPILPTKDVIHRIYRDVRFSSDKTPYKKSFSMSTSRGGRKGIWAGYYLAISPNGNSLLGAGVWQPGKDELATLRQNVLRDASRLRQTISRPEFVDLVGPPKPHPKGTRQNVFGHSDALKVAPKLEGVDKTHKDIDLLKLRSVAVLKHFTDDEVLQPAFADHVKSLIDVFAPFVHTVNDLMSLPGGNAAAQDSDNDDDDQQDDEGDEDDDDDA